MKSEVHNSLYVLLRKLKSRKVLYSEVTKVQHFDLSRRSQRRKWMLIKQLWKAVLLAVFYFK